MNISLLYCGLVLSSSRQSHPPPIFFLIQDSILSWLHRLRSLWQKNRKLINAALSPSLHLEARVPVMLPPLFLLGPLPAWELLTSQCPAASRRAIASVLCLCARSHLWHSPDEPMGASLQWCILDSVFGCKNKKRKKRVSRREKKKKNKAKNCLGFCDGFVPPHMFYIFFQFLL